MRPPPHSFADLSQSDSTDHKLFYEIPDFFLEIMSALLKDVGPIYINDEGVAARRVLTQAYLKAYQDFRTITYLLRLGYDTQAATLASSLMETAYFISYIGIKPEKAQAWIDHEEYKWDDNFNNWLTATLSFMVKTGELSKNQRDDAERVERYTYSILCSAKHNNGFALRKTNVIMIGEGQPELTSEPAYTHHSRAQCAGTMGTAIKLTYDAIRFYMRGLSMSPPPPIVGLMVLEAAQISMGIMNQLQDFTGQPRAFPNNGTDDPFRKSF